MSQSPVASRGRFTDASWIRFWGGRPEKMGGISRLNEITLMIGVPRGAWGWNDLTSRQLLACGTHLKLYYASDADFDPVNITPFSSNLTITDPITTTAGSPLVTVQYTAHGADIGWYVVIDDVGPVGGLSMIGTWYIEEIVNANSFKIRAASNASSSDTGGGVDRHLHIELAPGISDPASGYGFGVGPYGEGTYGTPRSFSTISFSPRYWTFGNFGKVLISSCYDNGLYSFDPTVLPIVRAAQIANAPTFSSAVVVTSDLIVLALGTNFDSAIPGVGTAAKRDYMQWWASAQGFYTNWDTTLAYGPDGSPSIAGRLSYGNRIVAGGDLGNHVTLVWTDLGVYGFQYTGSAFVFNIILLGRSCGLAGALAHIIVGQEAYWFGPEGFFTFNGAVQRIPNHEDVSDYVLRSIRPYYGVKVVAWYNQRYDEVGFAFVPVGSSEPVNYVTVSRKTWAWSKGSFPNGKAFSSAVPISRYDTRPILMSSDGKITQHESGLDDEGAAIPWMISADGLEAGNGQQHMEISGIAMDMERHVGDISVQIDAFDRSNVGMAAIDTMTQAIAPSDGVKDFRVAGRQMRVTFSGTGVGCDVRFGIPKLLQSAGGSRR